MNRNQQLLLSEEFTSLYNRRPVAADLIAMDGRVWKFLPGGTGAGVWVDLGAQVAEPGIDLALTEHVVVKLPPDRLIAMLLKSKAPVNEDISRDLTHAIMAILQVAGWECPDASSSEPIPGTVYINDPKWVMPEMADPPMFPFTGTRRVETDDLRPALSVLADPEVKTLILKDRKGQHRWFDLTGQDVTIAPDARE